MMSKHEQNDAAGQPFPFDSASTLAVKAKHYTKDNTIVVHIADGVIRDIETVQDNSAGPAIVPYMEVSGIDRSQARYVFRRRHRD